MTESGFFFSVNKMEQAYTKTVEEVAEYFHVDLETGLTDEQIKKARDKYGPNGKYRYFIASLCYKSY